MPSVIAFFAGFATGWIVRSSVDSTRGVAVRAVSLVLGTVDRAQRMVALEKEYVEDLLAEGRARFEAAKARQAARRAKPGVTLVPNAHERTGS